jgi:hypothetical protein
MSGVGLVAILLLFGRSSVVSMFGLGINKCSWFTLVTTMTTDSSLDYTDAGPLNRLSGCTNSTG